MGIGTFHSIWTIVVLVVFVGIVLWAFDDRRRARFDADARIPLDDDDAPVARATSSRLLEKPSRDAAQGENGRESAVYTAVHEHFEPDFDAAMRPSGVFQPPANKEKNNA